MSDATSTNTNAEEQPRGIAAVSQYMLSNRINAALWITRIIAIFYGLQFMFPILSPAEVSYSKVLLSNAATSALRLQQRIGTVSFTKEFVMQVMAEDSFHYLLYSLNFLPCSPVTLVTIPILLFAILHTANYSLVLCDKASPNGALAPRFMISLVELHQANILRMAAMIEIFIMPLTVLNVFLGRVNLLTPFMFYQFLMLRFQSRRNPYTRTMFRELRVTVEAQASKPIIPARMRDAVFWATARISALAPQTPPPQ